MRVFVFVCVCMCVCAYLLAGQIINSLMLNISADEPRLDNGTIRVSVTDGVVTSNHLEITVKIIPVNDKPPVLHLDFPSLNFSTNFTEVPQYSLNPIGFAVHLTGNVSVNDEDSGGFPPAYITATILHPGGTVSEGEALLLNYSFIAPSNSTINFTEDSFLTYSNMLASIMYVNVEAEPSGTSRLVQFQACDSDTQCSETAVCDILFLLTNDAPEVMFASDIIEYIEDSGYIPVATDLTLEDVDSVTLSRVEVRVMGLNMSVENVSVDMDNFFGAQLNTSLTDNSYRLIFTGMLSVGSYETLLQSLVFGHFSNNPKPGNLSFCVLAMDSEGSESRQACKYIVVRAVNDKPVIDLNGNLPGTGFAVMFEEGDSPAGIVASGMRIADAEGHFIYNATVILTNAIDDNETLVWNETFIPQSLMVYRDDNGSGEVTVSFVGKASFLDYIQALRSLLYSNVHQRPQNTTRMIQFVVVDELGLASDPSETVISVQEIDDITHLILNGTHMAGNTSVVYEEGSSPVSIAQSALIRDFDDEFVERLELHLNDIQDFGSEELVMSRSPDSDESNDNSRMYSFNFQNQFTLNSASMLINSVGYQNTLDEPTPGQRSVMVLLYNVRGVAAVQYCTINVVTVNDQRPYFERSVFDLSIAEEQVGILTNLSLYVRDDDSRLIDSSGNTLGTQHGYRISDCFNCGGKFSVSMDGELQVIMALDHENIPMYTFIVEVYDIGYNTSVNGSAVINLRVIDINDNSPLFNTTMFNMSVPEDLAVESAILTVHAFDRDMGSNANLTFSIVTDVNGFYAVDELTGVIQLSRALDRDVASGFFDQPFMVQVMDGGVPPRNSSTYVSVVVLDVNDNPPMIVVSSLNFSVRENATIGTSIGKIVFTDADFSPEYRETLFQSLDLDTDVFNLTSDGMLYVSGSLDRERQARYRFTVVAKNTITTGSPLRDTADVDITVTDVNDEAPMISVLPPVVDVPEDVPVGFVVLNVTASDRDAGANGKLQYSITGGLGLFNISQQGEIMVSGELDAETQQLFTLLIVVEDGGLEPMSANVSVDINVTNVNDISPEFDASAYNVSVDENAKLRTNIAVVRATDNDLPPFNNIQYAIARIEPDGAMNAVEINQSTGVLFVSRPSLLDREQYPSGLAISVTATDLKFTVQTLVHLQLNDTNDNSPMLSQPEYNFTIMEDFTPVGMPNEYRSGNVNPMPSASEISATDADLPPNNVIEFSILGQEDNLPFSIDQSSGQLYRNDRSFVDHEGNFTLYNFEVMAFNPGSNLNTTALVSVHVVDINDNQPVFSGVPFNFSVEENKQVDLNISATDADTLFGSLTYSLSTGPMSLNFTVDADGILTTPDLDFETARRHILTVMVRDNGQPPNEAMTSVVVNVGDVNDNSPVILYARDMVTVPETQTILHEFNINISDRDSGPNGQVNIDLFGDDSDHFRLNPVSYGLTVVKTLDFERQRVYTFGVRAADNGVPSLIGEKNFTVVVTNENDEPPIIVLSPRSSNILEENVFTWLRPNAVISDPDYPVTARFTEARVRFQQRPIVLPGDLSYVCQLPEDKISKISACGFDRNGIVQENAISFDGNNEHLVISPPPPPPDSSTTYLFVATWIMLSRMSSQNATVISAFPPRGNGVFYKVLCTSARSLVFQYMDSSGLERELEFVDVCSRFLGAWRHLAVYAVPQGNVEVYLNGNLTAQQTFNSFQDLTSARHVLGAGQLLGSPSSDLVDFLDGQMYAVYVSFVAQPVGLLPCFVECGETLSAVVPSGNPLSSSYANGLLSIRGNGSAAEYQGILNVAGYVDAAEEPHSGGIRQIIYDVNDGRQLSAAAVQNLSVILTNDADPVLYLNGFNRSMFHVNYVEEGSPVAIASETALSLTDSDRGRFYFTLRAQVIVVYDNDMEQLVIDEALARERGIAHHFDSSTGLLTLTGFVLVRDIEAVARTIKYRNTKDEPNPSSRTVQWVVEDSDLPVSGSQVRRSLPVNTSLTITLVNDAPIINLPPPSVVRYLEQQSHLLALADVSISDSDNATLVSAMISLVGANSSDYIEVNQSVDLSGVSLSSEAHNINISGNASLGVYASILQGIVYRHAEFEGVVPESRQLVVTVSDNIDVSSAVTLTISFSPLNDPPVLDLSGPGDDSADVTITYREGGAPLPLARLATVADPDNTTLESVLLTIPTPGQLTFNASVAGFNFTCFNDTHCALRPIDGYSPSLSEYSRALAAIYFHVTEDEIRPFSQSSVSVSFVAYDGILYSNRVFSTILFERVDDPPELLLSLTGNFTIFISERQTSAVEAPVSNNTVLNDPDSSSFYLSVGLSPRRDSFSEELTVGSVGLMYYNVTNTSDRFSLAFSGLNQADVSSVVDNIRYVNRAEEPSVQTREITVEVSDGTSTSLAVAYINITPLNDHRPTLDLTRPLAASVPENSVSQDLFDFNATDGDTNVVSLLVFSIVGGDQVEKFSLDNMTGVLALNRPLDAEQATMVVLQVQVDDGEFQHVENFSITVMDVNDNLPVFTNVGFTVSVLENSTLGSSLFTASVQDNDVTEENRDTTFALDDSGSNHSAFFDIDSQTGVLSLQLPLDADTMPSPLSLDLVAVNLASGQQVRQVLTIMLEDVNDECPSLLPLSPVWLRVLENVSVGDTLLTLMAVDRDISMQFKIPKFSLVQVPSSPVFQVHSTAGVVSVTQPLNREDTDSFLLNVSVTDSDMNVNCPSSSAEITLVVEDVNDNPPRIVNQQEVIREELAEGTILFVINASDADAGMNAELVYELTGFNDTFAIDEESGQVRLLQRIDLESDGLSEYLINVTVTDKGVPPLSTHQTVLVSVQDVNDNIPNFTQPTYRFTVPETISINANIGLVSAVDDDVSPQFSSVSYMINSNAPLPFYVDSQTGQLIVSQSLDHESECLFSFDVVASDSSLLSTTASVEVLVQNRNEFAPEFLNADVNETLVVYESSPIGYVVFIPSVQDRDGDCDSHMGGVCA